MRLSQHARIRMAERVNIIPNKKKNSLEQVFRYALRNGYSPVHFDKSFQKLLKNKTLNGRLKAKVYCDNIYLHSKNGKTLITVLNIPEEFQPWKSHLLQNQKTNEDC